MGSGCSGVNDEVSTQRSVLDWPPCSGGKVGAAHTVDCSSTLRTRGRLTTSVGTAETPARSTSKPSMDTAMTRKAGHKETTFRWVDVTTDQDTEERGEEKFSRPVLEQR
jgi:hypothetical protein